MKRLTFLLALLVPSAAFAAGLEHATTFVFWRDGAWIINFLILFSGIMWLIVRFMLPALRKRSEDLGEAMATAEKARTEAEARLAELDRKLREFEAETERVKKEAKEQGEALKAKIIADAEAAAKRILLKAQDEIASETAKAAARLKKEAVELALDNAAGLLTKNFTENDQRNALKDYLTKVGEGK